MRVLTKIVVLALLIFSGASCAESIEAPTTYVADIDVHHLESAELIMRRIAERRSLDVFEKPPEDMRVLNKGLDSMFLALYKGREQILVLTNVGYGDQVLLAVTPGDSCPSSCADELATEVSDALRVELGWSFVRRSGGASNK